MGATRIQEMSGFEYFRKHVLSIQILNLDKFNSLVYYKIINAKKIITHDYFYLYHTLTCTHPNSTFFC